MSWDVVRGILEANWNQESGYTSPNKQTYPWRWLWDSCFHTLLWVRLQPDRALLELAAVLQPQDEATGFVPHLHYVTDPGHDQTLWGRAKVSTITQPPMYGHAIRVMSEHGIDIPGPLLEAARRGIGFFLERRQHQGLITALHPWETGCDDSPRWDSWVHHPYSRHGFALIKGRLVGALVLMGEGVAVDSTEFRVGSVVLTALVAFNAFELAQEARAGVHVLELDVEVVAKDSLDSLRFASTEEAVVDEDAGELVADRLVDERGGDAGIHPAA